MKELFKKYEELEAITNRLEEAIEADPENEELETAWNKAYKNEYKAFEALIDKIVSISHGMIDNKTARAMIITKRKELKALVARMA